MNIGKSVGLGVLTVGLVFGASAETRTWTGGGDGTTWTQAANWDAKGAPVSGADDYVVIANKSGALLTVTLADDVSIGALKVTGATTSDAVTLTGTGSLTITAVGGTAYGTFTCPLYNSNLATTTLDVPLAIPEDVTLHIGQRSCGYYQTPRVAPALVINKPISGKGGIYYHVEWYCHLDLYGVNTYEGETTITSSGGGLTDGLLVYAATPFGKGDKVTIANGGSINYLYVQDGTIPTSFIFNGSSGITFYFYTNANLTGGITCGDDFTSTFTPYATSNGLAVNIDSTVTIPQAKIFPQIKHYGSLNFNGKVTCKSVTGSSNGSCQGGGWQVYNVASNVAEELAVAYTQVKAGAANIFGENTRVCFKGMYFGDGGAFDLNGKDQTFDSIYSVFDSYSWQGHALTSSGKATVTLKGHTDGEAGCVVNGKVTIVYDSSEGHVQAFTNRVNATSGDLIVSNGTLRVSGDSSFKNVKSLVVAGGTFEALSTMVASLSGVTEVTVGRNATLKVANASPFATSGVTIRLEDATGRIDVGAGVAMAIDAVYVGAEPLDGGTYSGDSAKGTVIDQVTGAGTLAIPENETPTKPASWTGDGADANVTTLGNWSAGTTAADLVSKGLYPTFAEKGDGAVVNQAAKFKGLVFDIPGGQATNEFTLSGTGPLDLYNLGLTVADPKTDEQYRYTVDVPLTFKKKQTWNLSASNTATVAVKKPITGVFPLTKNGAGTLELDAPNPDLDADFTVNAGKVIVKAAANAFGKASTGGTKIVYNQVASNAQLELHGTTVDKPVEWTQAHSVADLFVCAEGTNVFTQTITMQNTNQTRVDVKEGALLRTEGTFTQTAQSHLPFAKYGAGTYEIAGPFKFNTLWAYEGLVRIMTTQCRRFLQGNSVSFQMCGGRIEMTGENQLNDDWVGPRFYDSRSVIELNGFDQNVGHIEGDSTTSSGTITSCKPATLKSCLVNGNDPKGRMIDYGGQLSMAFTTYNTPAGRHWTNTINRAISTTGSLSLANDVAVLMTANASWLNPTNGTVRVADRAQLIISKSKTFSKKMDFSLAGAGKVELSAGVKQRCANLYLDGSAEPAELGTWGATGSGAQHIDDTHFAGTGVLEVRGDKPWGLAIIVR